MTQYLADPNSAHERAAWACWGMVTFPDDARHLQEAVTACAVLDLDYDAMLLAVERDGLPHPTITVAQAVTKAGARMRELAAT